MSSLYLRTVAQWTVYGIGNARGMRTLFVNQLILACALAEGKCGQGVLPISKAEGI